MQHRVVGQRIAVPKPDLLLGGLARQPVNLIARHDADVPLLELFESRVVEHLHRLQPRQVVRWWRRGHRILVVDALLIGLKGRRHREDRLAVLDRVHPASAERATVAQPLDEENCWRRGISGPDEVPVQRVHQKMRIDRAHRGHQRLAGHLTTEGALKVALFGAEHAAPIDVDLELLEIEDLLDRHEMVYQPRWARRCGSGNCSTLMHTIASPKPRDTLARTSGSSKQVVAFTIAAARCAGSPDLKIPEPTNTPSAPSCIIIAASAGVAMPPAVNKVTGNFPARATSTTRS